MVEVRFFTGREEGSYEYRKEERLSEFRGVGMKLEV